MIYNWIKTLLCKHGRVIGERKCISKMENNFESYEDYTECPYRIIIKEIQLDYSQPDVRKEKCVSPWICFNKECPAKKGGNA